MSDEESDIDYSDVDSPLSQSIRFRPTQSISHQSSNDRLYATSSRHLSIPDQNTPLLSQGDGWGHYMTTPSQPEGESSSRPLGILTRKISRVFQAKSFDYDNNKSSLAAVGSGERVWYV